MLPRGGGWRAGATAPGAPSPGVLPSRRPADPRDRAASPGRPGREAGIEGLVSELLRISGHGTPCGRSRRWCRARPPSSMRHQRACRTVGVRRGYRDYLASVAAVSVSPRLTGTMWSRFRRPRHPHAAPGTRQGSRTLPSMHRTVLACGRQGAPRHRPRVTAMRDNWLGAHGNRGLRTSVASRERRLVDLSERRGLHVPEAQGPVMASRAPQPESAGSPGHGSHPRLEASSSQLPTGAAGHGCHVLWHDGADAQPPT
jgi:hypothetical protein